METDRTFTSIGKKELRNAKKLKDLLEKELKYKITYPNFFCFINSLSYNDVKRAYLKDLLEKMK